MLLSAAEPIGSLPLERVPPALGTAPEGLSEAEAERRLLRYGANRLPPQRRRPLPLRFLDQILHFMALLLWIAGALAFVAGTPQLGWSIWGVVVINGLFSFWQEFQAERTLATLSRSLPEQVQVWRDGVPVIRSAEDLVAGDRLLLEEGDRVPADCRLIEAHGLTVDLAMLTGESLPVSRDPVPLPDPGARRPLATREQSNLVLAGSTIVSGRGEAFVYATGPETEFGQVARLTAETRRGASTLERQVSRIVHTITAIAVGMGVLCFVLTVAFVGLSPLESLLFAIGILVANVPEGLLPTVTLALALNVRRMARCQALVRRLSAVEALGAVSVICSDKTGTLTCNRMAVEEIWLPASGEGHRLLLLRTAALCSNARLDPDLPMGDPTETAILQAAQRAGQLPGVGETGTMRLREVPFDSHRRRMSVVVDEAAVPGASAAGLEIPAGGALLITKGAPLEVLQRCTGWLPAAGPEPLEEEGLRTVLHTTDSLARRGFRVIAVALRTAGPEVAGEPVDSLESALVFLGLLGLYDPPRPEVPEAILRCRQAGIKVTMVTGDHGLTAEAIARRIGLLEPPVPPDHQGHSHVHQGAGADPVRVIEGSTLAQISDLHLRQLLKYRRRLVFARMDPEQKLRLVQAYRDLGEVVAVTGDGVNDAPALRMADVGVAMGRSGTAVAREAADIVLLDDNFATIVAAVRCGRSVVADIGKFITYILASNVPEILPFLAMVLLRIPAALTVLQILAVDLGTDLLPALGLGAEAPEPGVMRQPPRAREQPLLDRGILVRAYLVLGLVEGVLAMVGYLLVWGHHGISIGELRTMAPQILHRSADPELMEIQRQATTLTFGVIVVAQMGNLLACRSRSRPAWRLITLPNPLLWAGMLSEPVVGAALVLVPPLAEIFGLAAVPADLLGLLLLAPVAVILVDGLEKRRFPSAPAAPRAAPVP